MHYVPQSRQCMTSHWCLHHWGWEEKPRESEKVVDMYREWREREGMRDYIWVGREWGTGASSLQLLVILKDTHPHTCRTPLPLSSLLCKRSRLLTLCTHTWLVSICPVLSVPEFKRGGNCSTASGKSEGKGGSRSLERRKSALGSAARLLWSGAGWHGQKIPQYMKTRYIWQYVVFEMLD